MKADQGSRLRVTFYAAGVGNPYIMALIAGLERAGADVTISSKRKVLRKRADIIHIHFPEYIVNHDSKFRSLFKGYSTLILLAAAKRRKTKVIWTVHNIQGHAPRFPEVEAWFLERFSRLVDGAIFLSQSSIPRAIDAYPVLGAISRAHIPHYSYEGTYPTGMERSAARAKFGIPDSAHVILFFGGIRRNKNLPGLIEAFKSTNDGDLWLLIGGRPGGDMANADVEPYVDHPRIVAAIRYIEDPKVQAFFAAADLAVLPYREITNSGSAMLALTFATPVLTSDHPVFHELQETFGSEWIQIYSGELDPVKLTQALRWATQVRIAPPDLSSVTPENMALKTKQFYDQIREPG